MSDEKKIQFEIVCFQRGDQSKIRPILERIGWVEGYVAAFEAAAVTFAEGKDSAVYLAMWAERCIGFVFLECHTWNSLAQLQGLAVDPEVQRCGAACELVTNAETFAQNHEMRGIYVDTPVDNLGGRRFYEAMGYQYGYLMPHYYEDHLDGVTYQKFFS